MTVPRAYCRPPVAPWLRIQRLLRVMLETEWAAEEWRRVKPELRTALKERARLARQGWFN